MEFYDDQFLHEDDPCLIGDADMSKITEQLTFPHSAKEPELSADELSRLDALADQLELQRLERLKVLQSPDCVPSTSKVLSTRFVRTWREKTQFKRAKQFGWGDQGSLPVSLFGWSLREKTYLAQRLAVSFPEFCQQFSWKDVRKRTW